ncbi:hypothetical protein NDU88_000342 [Pleurodeles waltl]|uniref:Uncharacterized protein n=1 Tax=Pleurodeles waltl TaxID=8319 RepID=A0AAV7P0K2_PLEWA|nr:hypothetical protein NDU88_000342 [Pleurodeles waltl]
MTGPAAAGPARRAQGPDQATRGPSLPAVMLGARRQPVRSPATPMDAKNGTGMGRGTWTDMAERQRVRGSEDAAEGGKPTE